ncbi:MAG: type II toxin-antitoxin system YafQ family toxin [Acidobacteriaceae bacterium]|nr:type II toxin-antitoxin system YafQ family toxin [Acidobacteriaceae bacterium]
MKREQHSLRQRKMIDEFLEVISLLAQDIPLHARYLDHALIGEWKDHRDCHIRPDLVLIYRKPDDATLQLVRLGSHAQLGL